MDPITALSGLLLRDVAASADNLGVSDEEALEFELRFRTITHVTGDCLKDFVGLAVAPPRDLGPADVFVLLELYHRARTEGCDRLASLKLSTSQLWAGMARELEENQG